MKINEKQLREIIDYLQGSCMTLNEAVTTITKDEFTEDDLTSEQHGTIDNEIFLCEVCGWWCEISEAVEPPASSVSDMICEDCAENDDPNYHQKNS